MRLKFIIHILAICCLSCGESEQPLQSIADLLKNTPSIEGKPEYLASPYVTAGDRLYLVGYQDGSFPELGWHIQGEMGGIWDHPIKLMDGFQLKLIADKDTFNLDQARSFINFPMANLHLFDIDDTGLQVQRWQFVPDRVQGLVVQLVINNTTAIEKTFQAEFRGSSDLRPTWLGERTHMEDGEDHLEYHRDLDTWIAKDSMNPWYVLFGADRPSVRNQPLENDYSGKGKAAGLWYDFRIPAGKEAVINLFISGSYNSLDEAKTTYSYLRQNFERLLIEKRNRYADLAERSKLTIPDQQMQQTFEWLKYNGDWLIRAVPEIGTGIMAGIPDYPWWFGVDSEYALQGYMAVGQQDIVWDTISLLDSLSAVTNGNGRIIHEVSTNGAVFNHGNINETPQFASLIWEIYRWNGSRSLLERYFPTIKKGLAWLMDENDKDNNLFPEGFGMMEIHGLDSEMIDVASYTQKAFQDAAHIAKILGEEEIADKYGQIAAKLKARINEHFWSEPFQSYADFIGTDQQAIKLIEEAIVRADTLNKPWAIEELENTKKFIIDNPSATPRPFVTHHNWVVNTPLEMRIADPEKAISALETASRFVNPFGVFVTGIDRDESSEYADGSFEGAKAFSYTGAVMTLPTGVQAVAENNYGRPDQALDYLKRMTRSFSFALPGSMYEVSPDYGMMTQAWNIYSFAVPIVRQFFGVHPDAGNQQVTINPMMPRDWDHASLENVEIGDNRLDIYYRKSADTTHIKVLQQKTHWLLNVAIPYNENSTLEVVHGTSSIGNSTLAVTADPQGLVEFSVVDK